MTILRHSQGTLFADTELDELTCFQVDFHAKTYALPGTGAAWTANGAGCGLSSCGLSQKPGLVLSSLRTSLLLKLAELTPYSLVWRRQVTQQKRSWWVLGRRAHRTDGSGSGLWPTPAASQMQKPIRPLIPSEQNGTHGIMTVGAVGHHCPELVGQSLNPEWAEALMGLPSGWTECDGPPLLEQALRVRP